MDSAGALRRAAAMLAASTPAPSFHRYLLSAGVHSAAFLAPGAEQAGMLGRPALRQQHSGFELAVATPAAMESQPALGWRSAIAGVA